MIDQKFLEKLINPKAFQAKLELPARKKAELVTHLYQMMLIRKVEQKLATEKKKGTIGGPVHLSVGQEAIAVGISQHLYKTDKVFSAHRSHAHLIALSQAPYPLFAEVLGKSTGCSRGLGGSMHLIDEDNGFYGSVPIVAGTVPLAVGAALASKLKKDGSVAVVYLGDGAVEEGAVQEALNFSKIYALPILFVIENNLYASHMHISIRQQQPFTYRLGLANGVATDVVDGNDVVQVSAVSKKLLGQARKKGASGIFGGDNLSMEWARRLA